jgi:hypothetical protein
MQYCRTGVMDIPPLAADPGVAVKANAENAIADAVVILGIVFIARSNQFEALVYFEISPVMVGCPTCRSEWKCIHPLRYDFGSVAVIAAIVLQSSEARKLFSCRVRQRRPEFVHTSTRASVSASS